MRNNYDSIIKENLPLFPLRFASELLKLPMDAAEPVTLELQKTIERRPDFVAKVTRNQEVDILHIEFQTNDVSNMYTRELMYKALLWEQQGYKYDILQYVFYLGEKPPNRMKSAPKNQKPTYEVIHLRKRSYKTFLAEAIPEVNIFAILADFGSSTNDEAIRDIVKQILSVCKDDHKRLLKCNKQLEILAQSRKLQSTVIKIQKTMPFIYDIRKDLRFIEGKAEGKLEGKLEGRQEEKLELISIYIENTLNELQPLEKIARIFGVPVELVTDLYKKVLEKQSE